VPEVACLKLSEGGGRRLGLFPDYRAKVGFDLTGKNAPLPLDCTL